MHPPGGTTGRSSMAGVQLHPDKTLKASFTNCVLAVRVEPVVLPPVTTELAAADRLSSLDGVNVEPPDPVSEHRCRIGYSMAESDVLSLLVCEMEQLVMMTIPVAGALILMRSRAVFTPEI
jgi:hypothetical protein